MIRYGLFDNTVYNILYNNAYQTPQENATGIFNFNYRMYKKNK